MRPSVRRRLDEIRRRVRRFERRELRELRRWLETTSNLLHLSILVFVPLLIGVVTAISNSIEQLSFLLFPPLAAGTYTLFADPEGRYASPGRFVAGLTLGALCGWIALEFVAQFVYHVPPPRSRFTPSRRPSGSSSPARRPGGWTWRNPLRSRPRCSCSSRGPASWST